MVENLMLHGLGRRHAGGELQIWVWWRSSRHWNACAFLQPVGTYRERKKPMRDFTKTRINAFSHLGSGLFRTRIEPPPSSRTAVVDACLLERPPNLDKRPVIGRASPTELTRILISE